MPNELGPTSRGTPEDADRLDSWKDIASYLQRDVSTVQRWEKRESMPVHRHVHDKQGSVYAFRSELDVWWRGRRLHLTHHQIEASSEVSKPGRFTQAGVSLATLAVVVGSVVWFFWPSSIADHGAGQPTRSVNQDAQDLLLRAQYLSVRTTDADNQSAIALLNNAIALDPGFARAHAELASAYVTRLAYVTPDETRELEEKAFAAAEKALSIAPGVPEAYLARGDLLWTHSHRFAHERAVQEFRHALALNPKSDQAHRRLARVFVHVGFFEEARYHADLALTLNPSNAQALNSRAQALLWSGQDQEALAIFLSIPGPVLPELVEANTVFALHRLGRRDEAWSHLRRALAKYGTDPSGNLPGVEALLAAESEPRHARELIDGVRQRKAANPSHHAAYFAASALARMGRAEEAVALLEEAASTGFPCYSLFERAARFTFPGIHGGDAEVVCLSEASVVRRRELKDPGGDFLRRLLAKITPGVLLTPSDGNTRPSQRQSTRAGNPRTASGSARPSGDG
jgi:tetratricopeptide (TPR) repeat protein